MGFCRLTAYEIVGNPNDIVIDYGGPDKKTGKFVGWITRGPGHNFKPLINTQPIFDTPEQAKQAMRNLVKEIKKFVEEDRKDPNNPLKDFFSEPAS
ncbi:MAG: hypothetical protein A2V60_03470 [Candidatus Portnoybacteria bacterium RIFCSPHIGHO2_01_FULL_39_19]|nr:MAG: hypothetical protein A2V60_03470 [Candidatus Portnoybacteria bacterium RIFCSPHIGHO2_01_FULL_39_19]